MSEKFIPTIKAEKIKVEYDGFYLLDVETTTGFNFTVAVRGYNLKSWVNFEKSLTTGKSCKFRLVEEEEYMKYHWSSSDISDMKTSIASAGKGNRKPVFPKKPQKPILPKKSKTKEVKEAITKIKTDKTLPKTTKVSKIARTDRNIGDITAFMEN